MLVGTSDNPAVRSVEIPAISWYIAYEMRVRIYPKQEDNHLQDTLHQDNMPHRAFYKYRTPLYKSFY